MVPFYLEYLSDNSTKYVDTSDSETPLNRSKRYIRLQCIVHDAWHPYFSIWVSCLSVNAPLKEEFT